VVACELPNLIPVLATPSGVHEFSPTVVAGAVKTYDDVGKWVIKYSLKVPI